MSGFQHLLTSSAGVRHAWAEAPDGAVVFRQRQDVGPILERAKAIARHNDGWSPTRELRRAATIPAGVRLKWIVEEGWDCFSSDPDCQRKLCEKLDSLEYAHLRTGEFRLGDHWRRGI